MFRKFIPNERVKSIFNLEPKILKQKGIKGIIIDLDNTLVAWDVLDAPNEIIEWFDNMREHGLKVTIISNNNEERVKVFSEPLNMPFIHNARKPLSRAFKLGAKQMELAREEVVVIGDQLLTDILGGNLAGFHTILVVPIVETDAPITQFNRKIERGILNYMRKRGKVSWEE